jgi:hypothetical protein
MPDKNALFSTMDEQPSQPIMYGNWAEKLTYMLCVKLKEDDDGLPDVTCDQEQCKVDDQDQAKKYMGGLALEALRAGLTTRSLPPFLFFPRAKLTPMQCQDPPSEEETDQQCSLEFHATTIRSKSSPPKPNTRVKIRRRKKRHHSTCCDPLDERREAEKLEKRKEDRGD